MIWLLLFPLVLSLALLVAGVFIYSQADSGVDFELSTMFTFFGWMIIIAGAVGSLCIGLVLYQYS